MSVALSTPGADSDEESQRPRSRYLTLAAARALECNGCGDCCDSRRTDGFWTWGGLPGDQYAGLLGARPLIIPLERVDGTWVDRVRTESDAHELSPTRFRCEAFEPQMDGTGRCALHLSERPRKCVEFPVWGTAIEREIAEQGEAMLETSAFPRCTWYGLIVVPEGDPRVVPGSA